jgi:uncharacterized protein DUF6011
MQRDLTSLNAALPNLSSSDRDFARSLLLQAVNAAGGFPGSKPLSEKQMHWVRTLAARGGNAPKPPGATVGDFSAVITMFATASLDAKRNPKIRLQLPNGQPIVLAVAGAAARMPGTVNVTDGGPFGANKFYGRVTPSGKWLPSYGTTNETDTAIIALLTAFAADPLAIAKAYGETTHHCCFCAIRLTDPRSKAAGYGPICAEKFGLAWG